MMAPSPAVSWARGSSPKLTSSYPVRAAFSSTALTELDPMSNPTSCLLFPPPNISRPLSRFRERPLALLPVPLAHLPFHPAVQYCFPKLPAVPQFERRYLALGDVAIERVRGYSQVLRRLPNVHDFARFAHREHPLRANQTTQIIGYSGRHPSQTPGEAGLLRLLPVIASVS